MEYAIIGLFLCLVSGWIYSEYRPAATQTRIALGGAVILLLCAAIYSMEVGKFYRNAHNAAAIRLLGEALDDGDVEAARNAIHKYDTQNERQTGNLIVEALSNRKRNPSN
ncbi:MAG: hypothetical protein ACKVHR_19955 [Pirellulales bacterium]|mgnify:CR=1 FL=1|jgi:hypothetical protein|tara:strand:- start:2472 stop:2801 length:330 start_codon:yes stop_codon:yes gene_type:complete